eukprot:2350041-Prymnesium_polylepis.2
MGWWWARGKSWGIAGDRGASAWVVGALWRAPQPPKGHSYGRWLSGAHLPTARAAAPAESPAGAPAWGRTVAAVRRCRCTAPAWLARSRRASPPPPLPWPPASRRESSQSAREGRREGRGRRHARAGEWTILEARVAHRCFRRRLLAREAPRIHIRQHRRLRRHVRRHPATGRRRKSRREVGAAGLGERKASEAAGLRRRVVITQEPGERRVVHLPPLVHRARRGGLVAQGRT